MSGNRNPYVVWRWAMSYTDAQIYYATGPKEAAEQRAHADHAGEMSSWPRSYGVEDKSTGRILIVPVDMIQKPVYVACPAEMISVEPATHVLWNGRACCSIPGLPKDWPPGHRWISYKDVADGAPAPADRCEKCWAKAPALIDHLRQIGSVR